MNPIEWLKEKIKELPWLAYALGAAVALLLWWIWSALTRADTEDAVRAGYTAGFNDAARARIAAAKAAKGKKPKKDDPAPVAPAPAVPMVTP